MEWTFDGVDGVQCDGGQMLTVLIKIILWALLLFIQYHQHAIMNQQSLLFPRNLSNNNLLDKKDTGVCTCTQVGRYAGVWLEQKMILRKFNLKNHRFPLLHIFWQKTQT